MDDNLFSSHHDRVYQLTTKQGEDFTFERHDLLETVTVLLAQKLRGVDHHDRATVDFSSGSRQDPSDE
ncbi:MAG: hypothetical protein HQL84_10795 [Magnetococcales bacterium]|nr:hypothetical protein [Magnetococcales bacterium]MBF0150520.1 hypothetical protein [Magnetococcales bacterium]